MSSSLQVSVVVAVYNNPSLIDQSLESVLSQSGVHVELIIVDDGSDEETKAVLQKYKKYPDVKFVEQQNHGLTKALIVGCSMARSPYIARLDVGDVMLPNRLREQARLLDEEPSRVLICSPVEMVTVEGFALFKVDCSNRELEMGLRTPLDPDGKTPVHASVMFRRDKYQQVGGYRHQFYFAQDLDLWTRLIEVGNISVQQACYTRAVFEPSSISANFATEQRKLRDIIHQLIRRRARGLSERALLKQAEMIRPQSPAKASNTFDGNYFIGKCLLDNQSRHAKQYLDAAVKDKPFSLKARWARFRSRIQ